MERLTRKEEQRRQSAGLIRSSLRTCHQAAPGADLPPALEKLMDRLREKDMREDASAQARAGAADEAMAGRRAQR